MPLGDGLLGKFRMQLVLGIRPDVHPRSLRIEQQVGALGWTGQRGIDGGCEREDEFGPARVPQEEVGSADSTEVPHAGALMGARLTGVLDGRLVDAKVFASLDLEGLVGAAQVDREAATSRGLPTDRAVTEVEGVGVPGLQAESKRTAVTGTLEPHALLPRHARCGSPDSSLGSRATRVASGFDHPAARPRARSGPRPRGGPATLSPGSRQASNSRRSPVQRIVRSSCATRFQSKSSSRARGVDSALSSFRPAAWASRPQSAAPV